jgi:hypothetical protein
MSNPGQAPSDFVSMLQADLAIMAARVAAGEKESIDLRLARLERIVLNICGLLAAREMERAKQAAYFAQG